MLAVATALTSSGVMDDLAGEIVLFAVPAEEYGQLDMPMRLRDAGEITYLSGKQELIHRGAFDDIDLALLAKIATHPSQRHLNVSTTSNACLSKWLRFSGVAASASHHPEDGVNALTAATLALLSMHVQRETTSHDDVVRINSVIRESDQDIMAVPAYATIQTHVRARDLDALDGIGRKIDQAAEAGAMAVGASLRNESALLAMPLMVHPMLAEVFERNGSQLVGPAEVRRSPHLAGSTDLGDISHFLPTLHVTCGGATGSAHGSDFRVTDMELACLIPAKALAMTVIDLLSEGASLAREIVEGSHPALGQRDYSALHGRFGQVLSLEGSAT